MVLDLQDDNTRMSTQIRRRATHTRTESDRADGSTR